MGPPAPRRPPPPKFGEHPAQSQPAAVLKEQAQGDAPADAAPATQQDSSRDSGGAAAAASEQERAGGWPCAGFPLAACTC